jgi:hypothetical protein
VNAKTTLLRCRRVLILAAIAVVSIGATAQTTGAPVITSFSGLVYNRATQTFNSVLTITNSGTTLYAPLSVAISTGSASVTVKGAINGTSTFATIPNGSLLPNESTTLVIAFVNPTHVTFTPTVTQVTGGSAPAGLGVSVTSPTTGQTPAGPTFLVAGTLTAPGIAGVSVDGEAACIVGSEFFVNAFKPLISPTSFAVAASDIDGGRVTTSVTISPSSKGLQVSPSPECGGVAPFTTTLAVSLNAGDGDSISALTVDFGAGAGPQPVSQSAPIQNVYSSPGLYSAIVTATTTLGARLTQSALISVQTPAQAFAPILANVSLLSSALSSQDVARAVSYHTYTSQPRYTSLLTQTGINLSGLGTLLSTAQPLVLVGNYAEVVVTAGGANGPQSSSVVLVRDGGGIWRVDSW